MKNKLHNLAHKTFNFLSSIKLAVITLSALFVLIFIGTLAQVELGIYYATNLYFTSFVVTVPIGNTSIPVFPGGFSLGIILIINLICAHIKHLKLNAKKMGIWLIHIGLILLLLGAGLTSIMGIESQMKIKEGESTNYSQNNRKVELVIIETLENNKDRVYSFSEKSLQNTTVTHQSLPFNLRIDQIYWNSQLFFNESLSKATTGFGQEIYMTQLPLTTQDDMKNIVSAYVSVIDLKTNTALDTFLLSSAFEDTQYIRHQNQTYRIELRQKRYYNPYYMTLNDFTHDVYPGTKIPHHFESDISIGSQEQKNLRKAKIYMNHPLRFKGKTYYQASFAENDTVSILQVVENPSWLIPYISCAIMAIGLCIHFTLMLIGFLKKQKQEIQID